MNKKSIICPACGSKEATRFEKTGFGRLTLGDEFSFDEIYYKCNSCGEEGDFFAETDKNYLVAQKQAQIAFVKQALDELSNADITMAMFERVFELPARTLTRWKTGDFSSSAIALLRIVITCHWIIEVAEHRFDSHFASYAVIKAAVKEFAQEAKRSLSITVPELKSGGTISVVSSNFTIPFLKQDALHAAQMIGA